MFNRDEMLINFVGLVIEINVINFVLFVDMGWKFLIIIILFFVG